jgi:predicted nucleotidyltransferase
MGMKKSSIKQDESNILFTKVQRSLLKLLYLHVNLDFGTNEIIRLTKSGNGAVQRELGKLTISGLITLKKVGNQKRYKANQALSYYSELRNIIIKTFGLSDVVREALENLPSKKIKLAFIYGSTAKQTDTANSDIDLLLIGNDLTYADIFERLQETEAILGRKINPTFYTPSEWMAKYKEGNNFIRQLIEQPKIFLIGREDAIKKPR